MSSVRPNRPVFALADANSFYASCEKVFRTGVFNCIFAELAGKEETPERLMIDATRLKVHRTAASLLKKGGSLPYLSHEGRVELEASCSLQQSGQACCHAPVQRADK
jgi:hypothetical protein